MSSHPLSPRGSHSALIATRQERAAARRAGAIQGEGLVRRAEDVVGRELAKGRISDAADVGHHAINEALGLEQDYKAAADSSPFESDLLRGITEDACLGIRYEVRRFVQGS